MKPERKHAEPRWSAKVPGNTSHKVWSDASQGAVYCGSGWGVSFAGLAAFRLDIATGALTAERRTRHQPPRAFVHAQPAVHGQAGTIFVATDRRLFELDALTLDVRREWDSKLVIYTDKLINCDGLLVMANWIKSSIGIFDPATGETRRVKIGEQPIIVQTADQIFAASGYDGVAGRLDIHGGRFLEKRKIPRITSAVAYGAQVWCIGGDDPANRKPNEAGGSRATPTLFLEGAPDISVTLPEPAELKAADVERGVLWAAADDNLYEINVASRAMQSICSFAPDEKIAHVDVDGGMVFTLTTIMKKPDGNKPVEMDDSLLKAYELNSLPREAA